MTQITQTIMKQTTCLNFNKHSQNTIPIYSLYISCFHKDTLAVN